MEFGDRGQPHQGLDVKDGSRSCVFGQAGAMVTAMRSDEDEDEDADADGGKEAEVAMGSWVVYGGVEFGFVCGMRCEV